MKVNITQFCDIKLVQGRELGQLIGGGKTGAGQTLTAAGDFTALAAGTRLIRVATDTAIYFALNTGAAATDFFMPANTVEWFAANGGEVASCL